MQQDPWELLHLKGLKEEHLDRLIHLQEVCAECGRLVAPDDRLPFDGGRAHAACVLARNLEVPDRTDRTERTYVRTLEDTGMPKPGEKLREKMRADGYISAIEAVELTGHARSTIYSWVAEGKIKGLRSGILLFVELASLRAACPQLKGKEAQA